MQKNKKTPLTLLDFTSHVATPDHAEDFENGMKWGQEAYNDAVADGNVLRTAKDVWAFLEDEISPRALRRDQVAENVYHLPGTPLQSRVGFVVGYLTEAFHSQ